MKETVLHIRIDTDLKNECESLFCSMGTNLSEAVRIFLKQCTLEQRLPLQIRSFDKRGGREAFASLSQYAQPAARRVKHGAWTASSAKQ